MMLTRPAAIRTTAARVPVTLMVFDILWLDRPLTGMTYRGRREVLEALALDGARIVVPPAWPGDAAEEALAFTREQGGEVEFLEFTQSSGLMRHPVWKGLRGTRAP